MYILIKKTILDQKNQFYNSNLSFSLWNKAEESSPPLINESVKSCHTMFFFHLKKTLGIWSHQVLCHKLISYHLLLSPFRRNSSFFLLSKFPWFYTFLKFKVWRLSKSLFWFECPLWLLRHQLISFVNSFWHHFPYHTYLLLF